MTLVLVITLYLGSIFLSLHLHYNWRSRVDLSIHLHYIKAKLGHYPYFT